MNAPTFTVRPYEDADADAVRALLCQLQGHVAAVDQLQQFIPVAEFDSGAYLQMLLAEIITKEGMMLVAAADAVAGVVVGWVEHATVERQIDCRPRKTGFVSDLVVDAQWRATGIGNALMAEIERHFLGRRCECVALRCMAANAGARQFYHSIGYFDHVVRMVKAFP